MSGDRGWDTRWYIDSRKKWVGLGGAVEGVERERDKQRDRDTERHRDRELDSFIRSINMYRSVHRDLTFGNLAHQHRRNSMLDTINAS